jgi:phage baseplate assembly protein W
MNVPGPLRYDYAFPLAINAASRQVLRADYPQHVAQMIRQFLLTTPGERVCLPDFGGGLRRLLFSPKNLADQSLQSTTELLIRQGLDKYLGQHLEVVKVTARDADEIDPGAIEVTVEYRLLETQTSNALTLQIR